jgi:hypothetical protein
MPYRQIWVEPDKNPRLESWEELPKGYVESSIRLGGYRNASKVMEIEVLEALREMPFMLYYCEGDTIQDLPGCGWVEGRPNEYKINTLGPLSGRRGVEFYCAKCGAKMGFRGAIS